MSWNFSEQQHRRRQSRRWISVSTRNRNQDERQFGCFFSCDFFRWRRLFAEWANQVETMEQSNDRKRRARAKLCTCLCKRNCMERALYARGIILLTHSIENDEHALWSRSAENCCKIKCEKTLNSCCHRLCYTHTHIHSLSLAVLSVASARNSLTHDERDYITQRNSERLSRMLFKLNTHTQHTNLFTCEHSTYNGSWYTKTNPVTIHARLGCASSLYSACRSRETYVMHTSLGAKEIESAARIQLGCGSLFVQFFSCAHTQLHSHFVKCAQNHNIRRLIKLICKAPRRLCIISFFPC